MALPLSLTPLLVAGPIGWKLFGSADSGVFLLPCCQIIEKGENKLVSFWGTFMAVLIPGSVSCE